MVTWRGGGGLGVVCVFAAGCFVTPIQRFGGGKTRQQVVHEQAAQLTPNRVRAVGSYTGDVQTKKIRVWADDDYRAQHVHWQDGFQDILDDANDILAAQFGVRLTAEYATWSYRSTPGAALEDTLAALASHDPGGDVIVVVGLTSSLSLVTAQFDALGVAVTPGKHLVIRGYSDLLERRALEESFEDLRKDERTVMFDARRHHKRLALLLHELGHTFGAHHAGGDPSSLMMPSYSVQSTQFDEVSRGEIQATLDDRLGRARLAAGETTATPPSMPAPPVAPPRKVRAPLVLDATDKTPVIEIVVEPDGKRTIDGKPVGDAQLDGVFLLAYDKHKRTRIYVRIDSSSPPAAADDIAARAKRAGLTRITVTSD